MRIVKKIKNIFDSYELKSKKSYLKNVYSVALADGQLANEEFELLLNVADKLYLNEEVVQEIIHYAEDVPFINPKHDREKLDQIYDCIFMSLIDGEINDKEIGLCKLIAVKFGFRPNIVDKIMTDIFNSIIQGNEREKTIKNIDNKL
ncbi:MAG: hypothetical protein KDC52_09710 [Ignavibacteriae bacterium]|nr:hypothetical protein [Ignavibacteriota bacterium]